MTAGAYFTARFSGTCGQCDGPIAPGDEVRFVHHVLQHGHCPDVARIERDVCPTCFTERSVTGACACEEAS